MLLRCSVFVGCALCIYGICEEDSNGEALTDLIQEQQCTKLINPIVSSVSAGLCLFHTTLFFISFLSAELELGLLIQTPLHEEGSTVQGQKMFAACVCVPSCDISTPRAPCPSATDPAWRAAALTHPKQHFLTLNRQKSWQSGKITHERSEPEQERARLNNSSLLPAVLSTIWFSFP